MPDPRFYDSLPALSVATLADRIGAEVVRGGDRTIASVAPLSSADGGAIAFIHDRRLADALSGTGAGCVIVPPALVDAAPSAAAVIRSGEAQAAWARASLLLHAPVRFQAASVEEAIEDDSVQIEPGVVLGQGCRIGRGSRIGANTVIGPGVQIGRDCVIGANATVIFALVGDRVRILSGARIGEAGFGAAASRQGPVDIPQLGRVIIQDGVTVGANTCIDRGALDDTVIEDGVKLDNLIQIGHNVRVGAHTAMAGCVGVAGSADIGAHCTIGGGAVVLGHLRLADGVNISAASVVTRSILKPGHYTGMFPIDDNAAWEKNAASLKQLNRLRERLKAVEQAIARAQTRTDDA